MALYDLSKKIVWRVLSVKAAHRLEPVFRGFLRLWYAGRTCCCPCCRANLRRFLKDGELCPACGAGQRQRLQWLYLERAGDFFNQNYPILDIAPLRSFQRYCLSRTQLRYISIDLARSWALVRADITAIPYSDGTFYVILCSHVLEHIPEDRAAIREIYRLLAPTGFALIQVPISGDETREDLTITDPEERRRLYGQEDHVRSYGRDFSRRLSEVGLRAEVVPCAQQFNRAERLRYGLDAEELLFVCHKE